MDAKNKEIKRKLFPKIKEVLKDLKSGDILINIPEYTLPLIVDYIAQTTGDDVSINVFEDEIENINKVIIKLGRKFDIKQIDNLSLQRVDRVWEKGAYSILGDVITIFPASESNPIRISLFGNEVESIEIIDVSTKQKIKSLKEYKLNSSTSLIREYKNIGFGEAEKTLELSYILNSSSTSKDYSASNFVDLGIKSIPSINLTYSIKSFANLLNSYAKSQYEIVVIYSDEENISKFKKQDGLDKYT
ncbi:MAG TPA: hypothetical protein VHA74_03690, partial [Candidatus Dojkabacteria bacterium]|nr:hypothetical protein [Candidatus Dojkabacteria bacterium]